MKCLSTSFAYEVNMVGDYYQNHELKYSMIEKIIKDIVNNKLKFSLFCRILYFYRLLVVSNL